MGVGEETWCDLIVTFFFFSLRVRETARLFISRLLFKVRYGKEVAYLPGTRKVPWLHGTAYLCMPPRRGLGRTRPSNH